MAEQDFALLIQQRLKVLRTTPFRAARDAGLPRSAIRNAIEGHIPSIARAAEICNALGLEFYIGPRRPFELKRRAPSPSKPTESRQVSIPAPRSDIAMAPPEPVGDPATERLEHRRLAEAISVLIEEYEALVSRFRSS